MGIIPVRYIQADRDRMWELYFGKKWSTKRIAKEYNTSWWEIVRLIDSESERRWRKDHKHQINRVRLVE